MKEALDLYSMLLKKFQTQTLASLYIVRYQNEECLRALNENFIKKITPLEDHPDILWVKLKDKENSYKVDSPGIKSLISFINYQSIELKTKLVFFSDSHLISDIVANKLLKIFEELPRGFCLFLLCPKDEALLETVESRAIKIILPYQKAPSIDSFPALEKLSLNEMLLQIKDSPEPDQVLKLFLNARCEQILSKENFQECNDVLDKLKHFEQSKNFNNSLISRLSLLY